MRTESTVKPPEELFLIEMTDGGKCNVHLYESVGEKETEGGDTLYEYGLYILHDIRFHESLGKNIAENTEAWLEKAKEKAEAEYTERQMTEQEITDLMLESIEQGQQITELELMILGGTDNV